MTEDERDYFDPADEREFEGLLAIEDPSEVEDEDWRRAAAGMYTMPGEIQIEPDAMVTVAETGAWVEAWVYVDIDDLGSGIDWEEL